MNETNVNQSTPAADGSKKSIILPIYLAIALLLTSVTTVLGALVTIFSFDASARYFNESKLLTALEISIAVTVVFAISAFLFFKRIRLEHKPRFFESKIRYLYFLPAIATLLCTYFELSQTHEASQSSKNGSSTLGLYVFLFFIVFTFCAIYYLSHVFTSLNRTLILISGIAQTVFCLYVIATLYFDLEVELNSPFKLLIQFTSAAVAIDTCMELRQLVSGVSTRAYIVAKTLSVSISVLAFVIMLCATVKGAELNGNGYLVYSVYFISQAICSCFALLCVKDQRKLKESIEQPSDNTVD